MLNPTCSREEILNQYDCFRACSIANDDSIVHPPRLGLTVNYTANWSTAVSQTKGKVSMGNGHCIFMPLHYDLRLLPSLTWQWPHFCVQVKFTARSVLCNPEVRAWHCQKQKVMNINFLLRPQVWWPQEMKSHSIPIIVGLCQLFPLASHAEHWKRGGRWYNSEQNQDFRLLTLSLVW